MASLRLDATQREHEAARGIAPVRAQRQRRGHVIPVDDFTAGADPDSVTQPRADQRIAHEDQPVAQRHPNPVAEFQGGGAGAAFLAIDDDEIGADIRFQHRLDDGEEFPAVADAELEADRLAARQFAQLSDESHHFQRCRKRAVG